MTSILGLHHVTATVAQAQADVDFFAGLLGLRLVKKTVNFDNTGVYHFYYGDEVGSPSTLMTTFPYAGQGVGQGRHGAGQISVTTFSIPEGALERWVSRLGEAGVGILWHGRRFGQEALEFQDPSGLRIELREAPGDDRVPWKGGGLGEELSIRGIHSVTLRLHQAEPSLSFLAQMLGMNEVRREGDRIQVTAGEGGPGALLELEVDPDAPPGVNGLGTVHHVALAVKDEDAQARVRAHLVERGVDVTQVRDRQYFRSIYFREPGGVLYEVATRGPGFTVDESTEELGQALKLPPWEEERRPRIEARLPKITLEALK